MQEKLAPVVSLDFFSENRGKFKKAVLVGGGFDILHSGHIEHLEEAKSFGLTLIVHVTGDERISRKKGPFRPVFPAIKRAKIISAIKFVDYVFIYEGRHYDQKVIDTINPDILFLNAEAYTDFVKNELQNLNFSGKIIVSSKEKENSTTNIIKKIQKLENEKNPAFSKEKIISFHA